MAIGIAALRNDVNDQCCTPEYNVIALVDIEHCVLVDTIYLSSIVYYYLLLSSTIYLVSIIILVYIYLRDG